MLFWFSCFYSHLNPKLELCTRKGEQNLLFRSSPLSHNLQILGARWICENNPRKHSHCLSAFLEQLSNGSERHRSQMTFQGKATWWNPWAVPQMFGKGESKNSNSGILISFLTFKPGFNSPSLTLFQVILKNSIPYAQRRFTPEAP